MDSSRSRLHRSVVLTSLRMPNGSVSYERRKRRTSKTFLWIFSVRIMRQRMLSRKRRLQQRYRTEAAVTCVLAVVLADRTKAAENTILTGTGKAV